ncbi:MAG: undecaprenyl/decaprenyl-phosphate alpha-N-acetylglucosaminyl 1-phosphate transferase [Bacteroidia bacterium]|nr:undecaprenyl/decaprenyl-phosphate alpha-N-acetylglucosaminyl 1-phosphate transferase [Bacteroidia bacterium]
MTSLISPFLNLLAENPLLLPALYFLLAGGFSFLIHSILLRFATTLGIRESQEMPVRWAKTQKPALGGIAFYIVFLFSIAFYPVFFRESAAFIGKQDIGLIAAATLAFLMGLADDAYDTRPWLKLFVQIMCGLIMSLTGTGAEITGSPYLDHALTIVWVVGTMNSINMLDNMDAVSTLVSLVILLFCILSSLHRSDEGIYVFVLTGIAASLASFLYFNWYPSRMFMGDTGSQLLGVFLSAGGIHTCLGSSAEISELPVWIKLAAVCLLFCIPITDTATVIINRILRGRSPFIGGKDHTTHSLFFRGLTERRIALLFTILSMAGAGGAYVLLHTLAEGYALPLLIIVCFGILFLTLFFLNRITIR